MVEYLSFTSIPLAKHCSPLRQMFRSRRECIGKFLQVRSVFLSNLKISDSSELTASCFSFNLIGVVLGPTMLEVIPGYSTSKNDLFLQERRLLDDLEGGATDNRLKTDGLLV